MALDTNDLKLIRDIVIEGVEAVTGPRFDAIEKRLDDHDQRLDAIDSQLKRHGSRFDALEREMRTGFASVNERLDRLEGKVEALENDVNEIYQLLNNKSLPVDKKFNRMTVEQQILMTYQQLVEIAKQAGVTLPR